MKELRDMIRFIFENDSTNLPDSDEILLCVYFYCLETKMIWKKWTEEAF